MRVRGLKQFNVTGVSSDDRVAPRAGAWIETRLKPESFYPFMSHPVRVRGLKHRQTYLGDNREKVAPRAGAWIETNRQEAIHQL